MYFLATATLVSEVGFIRTSDMEKETFPEWGLPMARPKEEDTEEWPGAKAAQYHPAAVGGVTGSPAVDRHLVARLPKFSGGDATPLEPYLAPGAILGSEL